MRSTYCKHTHPVLLCLGLPTVSSHNATTQLLINAWLLILPACPLLYTSSYTTLHRQQNRGFPLEIPYIILMVYTSSCLNHNTVLYSNHNSFCKTLAIITILLCCKTHSTIDVVFMSQNQTPQQGALSCGHYMWVGVSQ